MERGRLIKEIAAERIQILYDLAAAMAGKDIALSSEYVKTLRRMGAHYRVGIPAEIKDRICKKCNLVLIPGLTASVRLASSKGYVVYTCNKCKGESHIFYKRGQPLQKSRAAKKS
jgi:ribonuclease P protein subunit RPR2